MRKRELYNKIHRVRERIENLREYFERQGGEPERKGVIPMPPKPEEEHVQLSFSALTIFKIVIIALVTFYFIQWLGSIADILLIMFAAIVIASAFIPIADYFQRYHIPRAITVLLIYIAFFSIFGFIVSSIFPFLIEQLTVLANTALEKIKLFSAGNYENLPFSGLLESAFENFDREQIIGQLQDSIQVLIGKLGDISGSVFSIFTTILGNVFRAIVVLVLTFYMILEKDAISEFFQGITAGPHQDWITKRSSEIIKKMGDWLRGQTALSLSVGLTSYIGLLIIGNPFALTLGLLTALLEFIPYVGPIIAGVFAVLISLTISPFAAILTIILYVIIQFLENNILVPVIMRKAVGLSPVVSIFAILVAVKLIGGLGIILAIPIAAAVSVIIKSFRQTP